MDFNEQLLSAIKEGDNELAKAILLSSHLYNAVDSSGSSLIHHSVRYDNENITQFLVDNNCFIDAQDSQGNTGLIISIKKLNEAIIRILLIAGANLFLLNHEKKSALHILCAIPYARSNIYRMVFHELRQKCCTSEIAAQKLMDAGFPIHLAAYSLDSKILDYMCQNHCPVDSLHCKLKYSGMHVVVRFGDLKSTKVLLSYGANPKLLDKGNSSPLQYAYCSDFEHSPEKVEILKILLSSGVSPMYYGTFGLFEIGNTLIKGNSEIVRLALQSKLDFTARDVTYNRTVLHYLAQNKNPGIVKELNSIGNTWYDVDAMDKINLRPLTLAGMAGNVEMVKFLLSKQADPQPREHPALYFIYIKSESQNQFDQCIELLLQRNIDLQVVYTREDNEKTSLFDAACDTNNSKRIEAAIDQLLLSGKAITARTRKRIESDSILKEYFDKCQQLIAKKIKGSMTLSKMLNASSKKMGRYLDNETLILETKHFIKSHEIESSHPYLYSTWRERYSLAKKYKKSKNEACKTLCYILGNNIHKNDLIINHIIDYLDMSSLNQLALMHKDQYNEFEI